MRRWMMLAAVALSAGGLGLFGCGSDDPQVPAEGTTTENEGTTTEQEGTTTESDE